jgi:hypothetical protein
VARHRHLALGLTALTAGLRRLAGHRSVHVGVVLLGVVLALPALRGGFYIDDFLHVANLEDWGPYHPAPLDLYRFVPVDRADTAEFVTSGLLPWWSAPDLTIGFWRPLASGLLSLEHLAWGRAALPRHVHSVLWLVVLLGAGAAILRRQLPRGLGLLALLLLAVDDSRAMSVAWIAGRQALIATALVWLGLAAHLRAREGAGWRPGRWLAPVACGLGLLAGETALPALAYVFAFELCERRPGWWRALLPYGLLVLAYAAAQAGAHAGTVGSGGYLDPRAEPAAFLMALPGRLLVMLANLAVGLPGELLTLAPRSGPAVMAVGLACLAGGIVWGRKAWAGLAPGTADVPDDPTEARRALRWLALGAALALVPAAAGLPGERLLLPASLGAAAVLAALLRDGWRRYTQLRAGGPTTAGTRAARIALFAGLALVGLPNLVLAPLLAVAKIASLHAMAARTRQIAATADLEDDQRFDAVVLHAEDLQVGYLPLIRRFDSSATADDLRDGLFAAIAGAADPRGPWGPIRSYRVLSMAATDHVLRRPDPHTLELETPHGTLLDGAWATLFRAPTRLLPAGSVLPLWGLEVEVLADRGGLPTRVAFHFEKRLDDPELRFLAWQDGAFRRFALPPVGGELVLPRGPAFLP